MEFGWVFSILFVLLVNDPKLEMRCMLCLFLASLGGMVKQAELFYRISDCRVAPATFDCLNNGPVNPADFPSNCPLRACVRCLDFGQISTVALANEKTQRARFDFFSTRTVYFFSLSVRGLPAWRPFGRNNRVVRNDRMNHRGFSFLNCSIPVIVGFFFCPYHKEWQRLMNETHFHLFILRRVI